MPEENEKTDFETQLDYVGKTMKQNHELRQVCLEVLRCLSSADQTPLLRKHCTSELKRVLFDDGVFLH